MKKFIVIMALMLASVSFVNGVGLYVGAGYGTGSGTLNGELIPDNGGASTTLAESDFDATLTDFKLGFIFESNNRLEVSSTTTERDTDGETLDIEGIDLDYIWTMNLKDSIFVPFITAGLGLQELQTGVDGKVTGFGLNLGAGVYFLVSDKVEIELSYKRKSIDYSATHLTSGDTFEADLDDEISLSYLGVKFKF